MKFGNKKILIVYNLETNRDGLEHHFFNSMRKASIKNNLKEGTSFDNVKTYSCKCCNKSSAEKIAKEINEQFSEEDSIKLIFIIDNDKPEVMQGFDDKFKTEKQILLKSLNKKIRKKIEIKKIMLPESRSFHYLLRKIAHVKTDEKLFESMECRDKTELTRRLISLDDKPEGLVYHLQNKYCKDDENIFDLIKKEIFNDHPYLNYRNEIKNGDTDTYHWIFACFDEKTTS